ncbi:ABC transporter ATP-binding protein [Pelagibius sp. Alg239-R121]|uniref:ABC transporter ATP-binding protein n=1 Tax=Pelagibius sp. Alg239-R121 TaxID=2993448 RepID=UPI0024A6F01A|nr:ABC transporter ATP-binding protein [Pelagibius sp. Alg239-R121]
MTERILEVENLTIDIPVPSGILHAVQDISIHVDRGETLCIVGESGCGKSLTSLAIMDLLPKKAIRQAARLELADESIFGISERRMSDIRGNRMSMIFQEPMTSLNPAYTIGDQLTEALRRHRKVSRGEAKDRAVFLLEKVGITAAASRLGQYPHQLSGGLRQRVMIAMALMCGPDLIIADEPTTALDVTIQAQILHLLAELQREFNMGLILITHDLGVVARIADRIAVMYAGQIVETGSAAQIFTEPLHPYTRGLLDCIPIPGKTQRGAHLGAIPGIVPSLVGQMPGCHFASRCPLVDDHCLAGAVPLFDHRDTNRSIRCLRADNEDTQKISQEGVA